MKLKLIYIVLLVALAASAQLSQINLTNRQTNVTDQVVALINPGVSTNTYVLRTTNVVVGDTFDVAFGKVDNAWLWLGSVVRTNGRTANGQIPYTTNNGAGVFWAAPPAGGGGTSNAIPIFNGGGTNLTVTNTFTLISSTQVYSFGSITLSNLGTFYPTGQGGVYTNSTNTILVGNSGPFLPPIYTLPYTNNPVGVSNSAPGSIYAAQVNMITVTNGTGAGIYYPLDYTHQVFINVLPGFTNALVPIATGYTTAVGTISADSEFPLGGYEAWRAFSAGGFWSSGHAPATNFVQFRFNNPTNVNRFFCNFHQLNNDTVVDFSHSSDGVNWTNICSALMPGTITSQIWDTNFSTVTDTYFRWSMVASNNFLNAINSGLQLYYQKTQPDIFWSNYATNAWRFYTGTHPSFASPLQTVTCTNTTEFCYVTNCGIAPITNPGATSQFYLANTAQGVLFNGYNYTNNTGWPNLYFSGYIPGASNIMVITWTNIPPAVPPVPPTVFPPPNSPCNYYVTAIIGGVCKSLPNGKTMWDECRQLNADTGTQSSYVYIDNAGYATWVLAGRTITTIPWTSWDINVPADSCTACTASAVQLPCTLGGGASGSGSGGTTIITF